MSDSAVAIAPTLAPIIPREIKTVDKKSIIIPQSKVGVVIGAIFTPEISTWILEFSKERFHNRPISEDRVSQYGGDMESGRWKHNGETIKFDPNGVLVDGATRLTASFMHDVSFVSDVRFGVPEDAIATIDTGRPRTLGNVLSMRKEVSGNALSQGTAWLHRYIHKTIGKEGRAQKITHSDALAFLEQHPDLRESVPATSAVRNKRIAAPGVLVASHYILNKVNEAKAADFFEQLLTGVGYTQGSPVRHLRERLINRTERRAKADEQFIWILHAWNKWIAGEQMRILKLPGDIPTIKGFKA